MKAIEIHPGKEAPPKARILLLGYGNPGRQDDGLGPAAAAELERLALADVHVEINYQLNIEDAADAAEYERVLFVDAAQSGPEPFEFREVFPGETTSFTSHIVRPELLLAISGRLYGKFPRAWLMAIRGYEFELREELTLRARKNLALALGALHSQILEWKSEP